VAGSVSAAGPRARPVGGAIGLAVGLFVMWIIGLATSPYVWLPWWNFGFACAFLLLGIFGGAVPPAAGRRPGEIERMEERERIRRGA
jgi:hypothetical protein